MIKTDKRKKKFIRVKPPCYNIQVLLLTRLNEWRAGQNHQISNQRSEREKERPCTSSLNHGPLAKTIEKEK